MFREPFLFLATFPKKHPGHIFPGHLDEVREAFDAMCPSFRRGVAPNLQPFFAQLRRSTSSLHLYMGATAESNQSEGLLSQKQGYINMESVDHGFGKRYADLISR